MTTAEMEKEEIVVPDVSIVDTMKTLENSMTYRVSMERLEKFSKDLAEMKLETPEDEANIVNFIVDIKKDGKGWNGLWDKMVFGLEASIKGWKGFFKPKSDMYADLEKRAKLKLDDYHRRMREKADAEARKLEELRRKEQEKIDAKYAKKVEKAAEKGIEAPPPPAPVLPATVPVQSVAKTVKTESGSVTYRTVPKWEVEDISKIPAEYFILDEAKINRVVKAGQRNIAGLKIWEAKESSIRTN